MKKRKIKRDVVQIPTKENWRPSFQSENGSYVELSLHKDSATSFRIAIWGADDFGMEKEFSTIKEIKKELKNIVASGVVQKDLFSNGYRRA